MAPPFSCASTELDYPLYAVDFDQEDSNRLVVGGGGGAGRSGVGNKITVIETVSQQELRVAGEIALSRDEDSVMSLAIGAHKGKTTHLYAGVNSSPDSIAKGKNEHLRTLAIEKTKGRASVGTKMADTLVTELSRSSLFSNPDADTYQRLLRIAGQTGAVATAMGKEHQLAVFDAAGAAPKLRGVLELPNEAEDIDIIQTGEKEYQVAFCYKYELHVVNIGKEDSDPYPVFMIPDDDSQRPAFRSIRYITPNFILAAANLPKRSGVVLFGFRLPGKLGQRARLSVTAKISGQIAATAMAVSNLSPPATPTAPFGQTQFVVAVAGHDSSISLFTLEHKMGISLDLLTDLWPFYTLKNVHGNDNITGLAFSTFVTPKAQTRPQYIKLASISLQKTVAVHNIPLRKFVDKGPRNKNAPPRLVRYVVAMKSRGPSSRGVIIAISIIVLILAIIGQSFCEYYGLRSPLLHVDKILPSRYGTLRTPENQPSVFFTDKFISNLGNLADGEALQTQSGEKIVVYESVPEATDGVPEVENVVNKIQADVHDSAVHGPGKTWEELGEKQKEAWKARLKEAGAWTQNMGENVFKGVLFGELAGAVGRAVAG